MRGIFPFSAETQARKQMLDFSAEVDKMFFITIHYYSFKTSNL